MSRRLCPRRFRQALKADLPVQRRAPRPQTSDEGVWRFTFDADGQCISREILPGWTVPEVLRESSAVTGREWECATDLQYHRVRTYDPSVGRWVREDPVGFGLHDMHGNAWEWCQDWYKIDYREDSPRQDPQGPRAGAFRVFRGGSFSDEPRLCRAAHRWGNQVAIFNTGFRVLLVR